MMSSLRGFGWLHDPPDFRDYGPEREEIAELFALVPAGEEPPAETDLRDYFLEVRDQGTLNASPAYACAELYEYFERRAYGRLVSLSRLFLYRNARALAQMHENAPVDLRSAFKALVTFGGAPLQLWPDRAEDFDREPPPLAYAFAGDFRSLRYVRLDRSNQTGGQTLQRVKAFLAAGFPVAFGFSVPNSATSDGEIPYRPTFDAICGNQAAIAVGYDDRRLRSTRGALLIRNSWGPDWGDAGHAWLPYAFVENQLAADFWTLVKEDWLKTGEFCRPHLGNVPAAPPHSPPALAPSAE